MADPLFKIELVGARQTGLMLKELPAHVVRRVGEVIKDQTARLIEKVKAAEPVRTGKLRSETEQFFWSRPESGVVQGGVIILTEGGAEGGKAAALEYGAHVTTPVREHTMRLDHVFRQALDPPEQVIVERYTRVPNVAERKYLRGPFDDMRSEIVAEIDQAIGEAIAEGANS